ncbi:MAG TPA: winged helix-turn-helix domain-containing protein, partial [Burkholderiales bacterium]|nr:winged helix-turn-helix domain-containing protein [Burkholderiales bacterium]
AYGALHLNPARREVSWRGNRVELSAREFAVLEALMREPGTVVSRARLEDSVYGWGEEVGSNSIEVHLHHLRKKLDPALIRNVRGVGYRVARID